jgi:hypothetical protein
MTIMLALKKNNSEESWLCNLLYSGLYDTRAWAARLL